MGGQIMTKQPAPVVLSLERMNKIQNALIEESVIFVEAGAILADVQNVADAHGGAVPIVLGVDRVRDAQGIFNPGVILRSNQAIVCRWQYSERNWLA